MSADPLERYLLLRRSTSEARLNLRKMASGEIIDSALRIYQTLGRPILRLTALPATFTFAGFAFLFFILLPMLTVTRDAGSINTQVLEVLATLAISTGVALPIIMVGFSLTTGIVVRLVADYVNGSIPDERGAVRAALHSLKRMVGLTVYEALMAFSGVIVSGILLVLSAWIDSAGEGNEALSGFIAGVGILGYMVGFFIFLIVMGRHALTPAIVMLEGTKAFPAAKRSVRLMKATLNHPSAMGTIVSLFCILGFIALILWPAIFMTMSILDIESGLKVASPIPILGEALLKLFAISPLYVFLWVIVPIWSTCITILYFERRTRLEGYDIETLARSMVRNRKEIRFEL